MLELRFTKLADQDTKYVVAGPPQTKATLERFLRKRASGFLSPLHEVTLAPKQRRAAGIPERAAFFAFAYPISEMDGLLDGARARIISAAHICAAAPHRLH